MKTFVVLIGIFILILFICGGSFIDTFTIYPSDMSTLNFSLSSFSNEKCPFGVVWDGKIESLKIPPKENQKLVLAVKYRRPLLKLDSPQKIPKIIHQTHERDDIPFGMRWAMESILSKNQEYEYRYYNTHDRRDFIVNNFGKDIAERYYDVLIPKAYKADFFRYCVLYVSGGVYLDSGFVELVPLRDIISHDDTFISATDYYENRMGLANAFICCTPQHPILKKVLELAMERIDNREYGVSPLYPTGPLALGDAFTTVTGDGIKEGRFKGGRLFSHTCDRKCQSGSIKRGVETLFYTKYPTYRVDALWYCEKEQPYGVMWGEGKIYR